LAKKDEPGMVNDEQRQEIERLNRRLDMLDQRLDNIDSVVTAAVERVMSQPVAFNTVCPQCGKNIVISIIGSYKPTG